MHRTAGTVCVFGAGSELWRFSVFEPYAPQPPVTPAVGARIAFSLTTSGLYAAEIYTSQRDGTDLQRVTNTPDNEINIDWVLHRLGFSTTGDEL